MAKTHAFPSIDEYIDQDYDAYTRLETVVHRALDTRCIKALQLKFTGDIQSPLMQKDHMDHESYEGKFAMKTTEIDTTRQI